MKGIILEAAWPRSALRLSPSSVIRRSVASPRVQQMKVASLERYFIMVLGKGNKSPLLSINHLHSEQKAWAPWPGQH